MKTPKDFEYDLWISDDGACMVRIKSTGEVIEVEREVMRVPRLEEKRLRREDIDRTRKRRPAISETSANRRNRRNVAG